MDLAELIVIGLLRALQGVNCRRTAMDLAES